MKSMGRYSQRPFSRPEFSDPEWLTEHYVNQRMTAAQIAELLGSTKLTVLKHLRRNGIKMRPNARVQVLIDMQDEVKAAYLSGMSLGDVGVQFGVSAGCVMDTLERMGVPRRPSGARINPRRSPAQAKLEQAGFLEDHYVRQGLSINRIAGVVGCAQTTVRQELVRQGIEIRRASPMRRPTAARGLSHRLRQQIARERKECLLCCDSEDLQIHHRDGDRANNMPENLAVLCRDCHAVAEWFIRPVEARLRGLAQLSLPA